MASVLVFGVAVVDFVFQLPKLPDQAIKYRAQDAEVVGGGCAANAAVAISRLGGNANLVARIGQDEIGDIIVSGLQREGVDCSFVNRIEGKQSSFSSVYVDGNGERQLVNYRDTSLPEQPYWLNVDDISVDAVLADTRWPGGAEFAMNLAMELGVPGILDAEDQAQEAEPALHCASHVAFSELGLESWFLSRDSAGSFDVNVALRRFASEYQNWVCVTQGSNGVRYVENRDVIHEPGFNVVAVDTLGAGDVWHGGFALALAEKQELNSAIKFSNAVAALKCKKFGGRAGTPERREVISFLKENT